ncbi:hypothetical protein Tco_1300239 [Tanacetum coccineum]
MEGSLRTRLDSAVISSSIGRGDRVVSETARYTKFAASMHGSTRERIDDGARVSIKMHGRYQCVSLCLSGGGRAHRKPGVLTLMSRKLLVISVYKRVVMIEPTILVSVGCQKPGHLAARLGCAETRVATWDDLAFKLITFGWNVKQRNFSKR